METEQISFAREAKKSKLKPFTITIIALLAIAIILVLIFTVFMTPMVVSGSSMHPTLADGEMILVNRVHGEVDLSDIIVYTRPTDNINVVKRIVGVKGDIFKIVKDPVFTAGNPTFTLVNSADTPTEKDIEYSISYSQTIDLMLLYPSGSFTVEEGEVFTMGDNVNNSKDGRSYGCIKTSSIVGIVLFK